MFFLAATATAAVKFSKLFIFFFVSVINFFGFSNKGRRNTSHYFKVDKPIAFVSGAMIVNFDSIHFLRSFLSDTYEEKSSEWRAQKRPKVNRRSRTVIGR